MLDGGYEAGLVAHYAEVRRRLNGPPAKPRMALPKPAAEPEPPPLPLVPPGWPKRGWQGIVGEVCEKHGVPVRDVLNTSCRMAAVGACRSEIIHRMRDEIKQLGKPLSFLKIGARLGMNPSSVRFVINAGKRAK